MSHIRCRTYEITDRTLHLLTEGISVSCESISTFTLEPTFQLRDYIRGS